MIRVIEDTPVNAWPALQTLLLDGWVVRFANGYTPRANSWIRCIASEQDTDAKLRACEQLYHWRGLKVVFKMTAASQPDGLDAFLAAQGYEIDAPTSVQLMELARSAGDIIDGDVRRRSSVSPPTSPSMRP